MPLAPGKKVTSFVVRPGTHDAIRWLAAVRGTRICDELERAVYNATRSEVERQWLELAWRPSATSSERD